MTDKENYEFRRAELRRQFGTLYEFLSALLFEVDPAGINFETNTDEYEPEVGTVLPRLRNTQTVQEVQVIVHEEFVRWFGVATAGPVERYAAIARRIHAELDRRRLS
jgi:hypothetical protein